jgi:hypothetical protein
LVTVFRDKQNCGRYKYSIVEKEFTTNDHGEGPEQEVVEYKNVSKESYSSILEVKEAVFDKFHIKPEEFVKNFMQIV